MFLLKPIVKSFGKARERDAGMPGGAGRSSRLGAFAVEPRMLFDGAAVATADAMTPTHVETAHTEVAAPAAVMLHSAVNHDPVGHDNARTTAPGQKIWDGQVLQDDGHGNTPSSDPDGDALHLTGVIAGAKTNVDDVPRTGLGDAIQGQHGTLWLQADGSYWYKPDDGLTVPAGQTLHDVFSYKLCDDRGGEAVSTITISIGGASGGHAIDANPDEYWITNADTITDGKAIGGDQNSATPWHSDQADSGDGLHVVGIRAGDTGSDVSGSVGSAVGGQYGTLTLNADGSYGYVVNQAGKDLLRGERAQDVFTYTVADSDGHTATTTITIHLQGVNNAPVGLEHSRDTTPATPITDGKVLQSDGHGNGADYDKDGDTLHIEGAKAGVETDVWSIPDNNTGSAVAGAYGDLVIHADGTYTYTPREGVVVAPGHPLTDTFSYRICDDQGGSAIGTIVITLNPAGSGGGSGHDGPHANPDEYWITNADTIRDGKAIGGDRNSATPWHDDVADTGNGLHVVGVEHGTSHVGGTVSGGVGQPITGNYGTLVLNPDGTYTYDVGQAGKDLLRGERAQDTFTYTVADSDGQTSTTTITIHIIGVNNPPVGLEHVRETTPDTPITDGKVLQPDGHGNGADYDKDGDTLTIEGVVPGDVSSPTDIPRENVGNVVHGNYGDLIINRDGTYTYVPHPDLNIPAGQTVTDTFSYRLCDQEGGEAVGKIKVEIPGTGGGTNPGGGGTNPGGGGTNPGDGGTNPGGGGTNPGGGGTNPGGGGTNPGDGGTNPGGGGTNPGGGGTNPGDGGTNPGGGGTNPGGGGTNPGGGGTNPGGGGTNPGGGGTNPGGGGTNPGGGGTNPGGGGTNPGGGGTNPGDGGTNPGGGGTNPGGGGTNPGGGSAGGGDGSTGAGTATGPQLPVVPAGFTNPAISSAAAPTPAYSAIDSKPVMQTPLVMPQDQQGPIVFERVKGVVEEAPAEGAPTEKVAALSPALLAAARQPVKATDDCVPAPKVKTAAVAKPKPKIVASSVFAKPDVVNKTVPKSFSEQVKTAAKRPPVAHRAAPTRAPVDKGC